MTHTFFSSITNFDVLALMVQIMNGGNRPMTIPSYARLGAPALLAFGVTLLMAGCGTGPQAEFKFRKSTGELIPEVNKAFKKTLKDSFGTPQELVAWETFPIEYGGVQGTVESTGTTDSSFTVALLGNTKLAAKGKPVLWLTGANAGTKTAETIVNGFNAEKNELTIARGSAKPDVGDRFIIAHGTDLQFGRIVYMKNCMHCHGVTGDGAGPTGEFLNPRPRDYRHGQFKFTSTKSGEKATRDDLHRILQNGIPGTYMPSFLLLGERETTSVVEYVRWLAMRGEFEKRMVEELTSDYSTPAIADAASKAEAAYKEKRKQQEELKKSQGKNNKEKLPDIEKPLSLSKSLKEAVNTFKTFVESHDYDAAVTETAGLVSSAWVRAEDASSVIHPSIHRVEDTTESRERGRLLYMGDKTKCYTCHGPTGRGDGVANEDFWAMPGSSQKYERRGLHDEWGNPLKPRNLTLGQYRGGRRPVDLFRRMYAGIKGTPMPAFGGTALTDEQLWDLVNYVMSLPYESKGSPAQKHEMDGVASTVEKSSH